MHFVCKLMSFNRGHYSKNIGVVSEVWSVKNMTDLDAGHFHNALEFWNLQEFGMGRTMNRNKYSNYVTAN